MKKVNIDPEMLQEYDFTKGVRGKYARRFSEGTDVVLRDPDVAVDFPRISDSHHG